jgi:hypothetical protein
MARNSLEYLHIGQNGPKVTIVSLKALARSASNLQHLRIDGPTSIALNDLPYLLPYFQSLCELELRDISLKPEVFAEIRKRSPLLRVTGNATKRLHNDEVAQGKEKEKEQENDSPDRKRSKLDECEHE